MGNGKRILHGDTSGVCYSCLNGQHKQCDGNCKCALANHKSWWWKTEEEILGEAVFTLEDIKEEVAIFSDKTFGKRRSFKAPLYHLIKEAKETIEATKKKSLVEFADCLLLILDGFRKRHPNLTTDDLLRACHLKLIVCEKREWGKPDKNGVIQYKKKSK